MLCITAHVHISCPACSNLHEAIITYINVCYHCAVQILICCCFSLLSSWYFHLYTFVSFVYYYFTLLPLQWVILVYLLLLPRRSRQPGRWLPTYDSWKCIYLRSCPGTSHPQGFLQSNSNRRQTTDDRISILGVDFQMLNVDQIPMLFSTWKLKIYSSAARDELCLLIAQNQLLMVVYTQPKMWK
jgi:hypothetical protein